MSLKLQYTPWMYWKLPTLIARGKKHKFKWVFLIFYHLLLSLPRVSLAHLIIMYDFEYKILIITIYNTSAKSFLCKVQKAKFVFVLVKACSCIVQLFSGVWNVLSTPRNAIFQIFTPIFVSYFVSCNVIDKEFYNSDAFENSRYDSHKIIYCVN